MFTGIQLNTSDNFIAARSYNAALKSLPNLLDTILLFDILIANTKLFVSDDSITPSSYLAAGKTLPSFSTNMLLFSMFA